jgi:hypothetical protein
MGDYPTKVLVRRRRVCENVLPVFFSFVLCLLAAKATAAPLQISGNHAFLTDSSGRLQIVNIANETNPVIVTTYPNFGGVSGISLHGAYASATLTNDGLIVFDVTQQPPALVPGGRYVTSGNARDVQVVESTAFVADGTNGIVFLDLFDVHTPINLFTLGVPGSVSALEVREDYLYAVAGSGGLRIYDVTALNDPEFVGAWGTADPANRLRLGGNYAYVACDGGRLEIVSIQNPAALSLVATYLTSGRLSDIDVVGNYALLGNTNGTVVLLEISDPTDPIAVSTNTVAGGVTAVRLVGANAYVRTATGGLVILPLTGPTPTAPELQAAVSAQLAAAGQTAVMSVSIAGTPPLSFQWRKNGVVLTNDARISGTTNAWLVISNSILADTGNYAVTVSNALGQLVSSNGLTVVNPGAPVLRGEFHPGGSAQSIAVKDFAAYVAAGTNGLEIFSVVNPQLPYRIGGNDVVGFSSGVQVAGATAYVATGSEGLQLFNITSLPVAVQVAATNTAGTARGIYLAGGWIYVADGENGLQIFSFNGAAPPAFVAGTNTPGFAWNVAVADGVAYVADGTNGLQIFSVTNAATLAQIGTYDTPGEARNVRVFAGKAYVADGAAGLVVLDVSNPASPSLLGSYAGAAPALDLELAENTVVVARGSNGVESLDISVPASITSRGVFAIDPANGVRLEGNRVYVAAGTNGVRILELVGLPVTAPAIDFVPSDVVVLAGASASFPAVATGTAPLTYQWYRNGLALTNGPNLQGVAAATLAFANLTAAESGDYVLEVRNAWNLFDVVTVNLAVVPFGTPVFQSGYFYEGDALNTHVVGQLAFLASRLNGLQVVDWRDPLDPVLIGQHPTLDFAQDVRVQGRYAYVASWQAGLEIFDVLNPTNLVRVGFCDTPGLARQVRVSGNRAFVADHASGFAIIDVSDPTRPALLGTAATGNFAEAVVASSNHVFVAAASSGLQVFNAANPLAPSWLAGLDTPGHAENLTVINGRAYLADYNRGLQIVDVANPAAPTWLGEFQTDGDAFQVQVISNRAYVASGISKVSVLDVANPAAPAHLSTSLAGESVRGLQIVGQHALYADRSSGLVIAELLGMGPIPPGIVDFTRSGTEVVGRELVLSVASEGTPPLSYLWLQSGVPLTNSATVSGANQPHLRFPALAITNAGNYAVIVSNAQGSVTSAVATVSVNAFGAPLARGVFNTPGSATAAAVFGNIGFIADGASGVRMVNLTNLDNPASFGSYAPTGSVFGLCLQTNLLYLALGSNGVAIVDVSTPEQPVHIGAFDTPGTAFGLDVIDGRAFVADGVAGLRIFNVTNPASPTALGFLDTSGSASEVRVINNLAYVADGVAGLQIISVTNVAAPVQVGSYSNAAPVNAVRVSTNRVYLANGNLGLQILEVTNPAAPVSVGNYPAADATALDLVGNLVLLANGASGYLVLDVSNPTAIALIGSADPGDTINGVVLLGNLAFLSSATDGLRLIELAGVAPVSPTFLRQPTNTAVLFGGTAQFQAWPVHGTPALTYRWYFNGLPVFNDARIAGADTTRLTITNVGFADAGSYQLRVLGPAGVTNSSAGQLTFIGPLQAQINAATTGAVVNLSTGVYTETLVFDRNLTLSGQWWDKPVLSGGYAGTVLRVLPGVNVTLRGVAIRYGSTSGSGGGILNEGTLTLDHCLVADNSAGTGGGIANLNTLVLQQSVVSNNYATTSGGGLYTTNSATTTVTNSTFIGNFADAGGGIANLGTNNIANSLIANNLAFGVTGLGGGLRSTAGYVRLVNTTVSGNEAFSTSGLSSNGRGGGIQAGGGEMDLYFSTIAANTALVRGGGVAATASADVYAQNSIFADNDAPVAPDYSGTLNSEGHNLIQAAGGLSVIGNPAGNQINANARLGPLLDHGGPTLTHAPEADSPVIDAGVAPGPATDARGIVRPFDTPWAIGGSSLFDLGAFEHVDQTPYLIVSNRTAAGFQLVWKTNSVLQKSLVPDTSWADQTNGGPLFVSTLTNVASFFRLRALMPVAVLSTNNQTTNGFTLTWPDFGILEHAPTTNGPWEPLSGLSPFQVTLAPGQNEFFRLRVINY